MFLFLAVLLLAGVTIKLLPNIKLRGVFLVYYIILYIVLSGIDGLLTSNKQDIASNFTAIVVDTLILCLHLPFIFRLYRIDRKKHIKQARDLFGEHVWQMDDSKLHQHLRKS